MKFPFNSQLIRVLAAGGAALCAHSADAQIILQESFDYSDEAALDAAYLFGDAGKTHFNSASLIHPNVGTATGGRASFLTDRIKRNLGQTFGNSDGTIFVQFLLQSSVNTTTGGAVFRNIELYNAAPADTDANRTYAIGLIRGDGNTASAQFEHRAYIAGQTNATTPDLGLYNADVNLLVAKFTFTNGGANFTVDAWLNPNATTDYSLANNRISGSGLKFSSFSITSVAEAAGTAPANFDEIRFSNEAPNTNIPPAAVADSAILHHQSKVLLDVLKNDGGSANAASIEILQPPAAGIAIIKPDGKILYTQTIGTPATDSFTYRVANAAGLFSQPATVSLTLTTSGRIANTTSTMPATPPPSSFTLPNAFAGVTFNLPSCMEAAPGETHRIFVAERSGKIFAVSGINTSTPVKTLVLDISGHTEDDGNEEGFKGFAFHPNFASNGYVFASYASKVGAEEYVRVSRFTATNPTGNTTIDPATEQIFIDQLYKPSSGNTPRIHNINECNFGPDGYLYVGFGDEDGHPDPSNNSQRINKNFWSGLIRIDVDKKPGNIEPTHHAAVVKNGSNQAFYSIPADNPFIGATSFNGIAIDPLTVRTEFYAVGLRNPWQFSWDPLNNDLWLGDVGFNTTEEINRITKGGNYGWAFFEGTDIRKGVAPAAAVLTPPVHQYIHGNGPMQGNAIIGGLVVRGTRYPSLTGKYLFADHLSGNIWTMQTGGATPVIERIAGESGISAFAPDPASQDVLLLDHIDGVVRRLATSTSDTGFPQTLSATGIFADLTDLAPNPGVVAYEPNLTFWSDFAVKKRWFASKNLVDRFGYSRDGAWTLPTGTLWVKHFDLDLERGNPATRKRLETRLIMKTATGNYGVSYRWNEAQTEATLVPDAGDAFDLTVTEAGISRTQRWQIPSRSQCISCHNPNAGHALSFNTRQLNRTGTLAGISDNFLSLLYHSGYLDTLPEAPAILPRHVRPDESAYTLDARARSYLAVNCSYCHQSGGPGGGDFDLSSQLSLSETRTINGEAGQNGGNPLNKLIVPGNGNRSVIWNRAAAANGFTRMPPLATNEIDQNGVQLLLDWISQELPALQTYAQWRLAQFENATSSEGAAEFDADNDGFNNRYEFLVGTNPRNASSSPRPSLAASPSAVSFANIPGRSLQLESSTDLATWSLWNVPGNDGLPFAAATKTISNSSNDPHRFFRLKIREN